MKNKRLLYIELLRVLAILFVIFNHTAGDGFLLFTKCPSGSVGYWIYSAISVFCEFAVPVFFMISGVLLLNKNEPLKVVWRKRILRMVVVLVVISLVYYLFLGWRAGRMMSFGDFWQKIWVCGIKTHLWFIYAYIGFLIALPFLRSLVQKLDTKYFYYWIVLSLVFLSLHFLAAATGGPELYGKLEPVWLLNSIVLYPSLGYFMEHRIRERYYSGKQLAILWAANIASIVMTCALILKIGSYTDYMDIFTLVNAICVFYSAKLLFKHWQPGRLAKGAICALGGSAFGVYLIHLLLLPSKLAKIVMDGMQVIGINEMVACWVWCVMVFLACSVLIWLIKKIPFVRKFI